MWKGVNNAATGTPPGAMQGKIVASAGACAELCREFGEKCQSFSWRPDKGNSCWLKSDWTSSNERSEDVDTWSGIRCDADAPIPERDPDGSSHPSLPSCESPEQVTYWKGVKGHGPVLPRGPMQFQETPSVMVCNSINH